jgi:sugar lactone lactonase YvrE
LAKPSSSGRAPTALSTAVLELVLSSFAIGQLAPASKADAAWRAAGADEGLRQAFERATYSLEESGHGTWRGANAAQRLTLEFNAREAWLSHPDGGVSFHLSGYGYGDRLRKPARARLAAAGSRVEYQRRDLTEWYLNRPQGLEQGFDLARRPGTARAGEPLVIALGVGGGLSPVQEAGIGSVLFVSGRGAVLRYAGLRALDARGRILPSRLEVRGREIRLTVEDQGAQYPVVVDPTWTQQQELMASDDAPTDYLGMSVSVSGDTAVVGADNKTVNSNGGQGAAYVFVRTGGVWSQQQKLTANDGAANDHFGCSVSVSGDAAVIGADNKTVNSNGGMGAAYVFVRSGGVWSQQQELTASDGAANDHFGASSSLSGVTAVIGNSQGAAYVFVSDGLVWAQQQKLAAPAGAAGFGRSVSVSGDTVVVGAAGANSNQGAAYVFVQSSGVWSQQQELTASDGAANDQFGGSVSVSGDTAVIGATGKNSSQGAAYVFVRSGGGWSQQQELTASDGAAGDVFGSVSVSGDTAVIGAENKTVSSTFQQGAAYVFALSGGVWGQQQELTASDGAGDNFFGSSVSVSWGTAVVGAPGKGAGLWGAAYVFTGPALGANSLLVGSAAGASSVALASSGAWTATANSSFLHVSAGSASGTGNAVVVFSYDAFTGTGTRTGTLTIAGLTVTVTQAGTNYIGPGPVITLVSSGLAQPQGVAVDGSGDVYFSDTSNYTIKEWSAATQQVTTLATLSVNDPPWGVAADGYGNVYVADDGSIKEWAAATQQLTTLVSSGVTPVAAAVDTSGNVYMADISKSAIEEWNAATQQVTTLVTGLNNPWGVAVDLCGNAYVADTWDNVIREWNVVTRQVTTLAAPGLNNPHGAAVDGSGNVYIADTFNGAIKVWSAATQQTATLASSGLSSPRALAVDSSGSVYIADAGAVAVLEIPNAFVGPASLSESASAGSDALLQVLPATTHLTGIFAPTSDQSWLTIGTIVNGVVSFSFTADTSITRTAHITLLGHQITVTQTGSAPLPQTITFGSLSNRPIGTAPFTVTAAASSNLTVSFSSQTPSFCTVSGSTVTLVAAGTCTVEAAQTGNTIYAAATPVDQSFQVQATQTITFPSLLNRILGAGTFTVAATASSNLPVSINSMTPSVCTMSGATVTLVAAGLCWLEATQPGNANYAAAEPVDQFFNVTALATSLGTTALLVGGAAGTSSVFLATLGAWTATANNPFLHVSTGSANGAGSAVVVFTFDAFPGSGTRIGTLTIAGLTLTVTQAGTNYIGPGPAITLGSSVFQGGSPLQDGGVAVDHSGNVYFADTNNGALLKWSPSTQQITTLIPSGLAFPQGLAVDNSGNVYIANTNGGTILEWSASTQQVTGLVEGLNHPNGVAVDGAGNVYFSNTGANAIMEDPSPPLPLQTLVWSGLSSPSGVAVDRAGNVYIADTGNNAIKEWNAATQQVTTLISSGPALPIAMALDGSGNVYMAGPVTAIEEWSAATHQITTLPSGTIFVGAVAVDTSGNVYFTYDISLMEIPNAFVGPASLNEPASAGADSLLPVVPSTTSLAGVFAPTCDQGWLTIGNIVNGVVNFSFTANTTTSARVAHITVLGQPITVSQNGLAAQTITFGALSDVTLGVAPFTISATASSGLTVSFTSTTISACTVSGNKVTILAVGTCSITASQAGNTSYAAATSVTQSLTVRTAGTYLVGDIAPYTSDWAPNFGDWVLDIRDLIQELFAVNNIPGFKPAACSDRFDAMDVYPADTASARGGNGVLDIRDLILELFRVNNLDMSRPVRVSLGGALPWAACTGGSSGNSTRPTEVSRNIGSAMRTRAIVHGALVMGRPERAGEGEERIPVYLEAKQDLVQVAVTFGLGDQQSQLRFVPTAETPPSMVEDSQLGAVAAAWLNGVSVRAGERLLLGYVSGPAGVLANLNVYAVSASRLADNREVRLDAPAAAGQGR